MGRMRFYFNKQALESLARELRRASWAIAVSGVVSAFVVDTFRAAVVGGIIWLVMQIVAVVLESVRYED